MPSAILIGFLLDLVRLRLEAFWLLRKLSTIRFDKVGGLFYKSIDP